MIISLSVAILCKNEHLFEFGHWILFKKNPQYFVVPKNTRIILVSISKESTHKMADAASISFEYVIYAEYNFLLLSGFVFWATKIFNIRPYCPKYLKYNLKSPYKNYFIVFGWDEGLRTYIWYKISI